MTTTPTNENYKLLIRSLRTNKHNEIIKGIKKVANSYAVVHDKWSYLFDTVGVASDMTGAYQDQEDLAALIANPTKQTACNVMIKQMDYWFSAGIEYDRKHQGKSVYDLCDEFPRIATIAASLGQDLARCPNPFAQRQ